MAKEVCLCGEPQTPLADVTNFLEKRRTANYSPSSWDFSSFAIATAQYNHEKEEISDYCEETKNSIRSLICEGSQLAAKLNLIDMLQRLGVAYHFSEEIKSVLEEMDAKDVSKINDLACLILCFRLMRENCYEVPQDILDKIIMIVRENPQYDVETLISLYDASFLAFAGEKLSHKVTEFSTKQLMKQLRETSMDQNLKEQLEHALEMPLHWRVPRLEIRRTIDQCQRNENVFPPLITLAKLEYNQVQLVHQTELSKLLKWWLELGLKEKLPFARDRLVESFFIAAGIVPEPHNADFRETLSKLAILIVVLDDVYDVYATFDELLLFNEAIYRWDDDQATKGLPEYMKALYSVILNTTKETTSCVQAKYGWDASPLLIKAWQDLCCSFLSEAKWYHTNYKPSFEEYLENGWMSSTAPLLLTHGLTMLADRTTVQKLNSQNPYPRLVQSCATVLRLMNDLATHHAEVERGDAPSSIACFMRERSCTERCASKAIEELIMETWKTINEDSMMSHGGQHGLPRPFVNVCVNLARISLCVYSGGDGVGVPDQRKKDLIRSFLSDPVSMD